ncbi:hypothetical protein FGG64_gp39 [Salinibacter phage M8CR30-2]|uniref:Uncharacterized protein n=1 Tax=Salinibacter phage M8CR30-2 TaxID=2681615 RepID=A0A2I6UGC7_9CAUD|nr:hypothetical protein FGG64_gp39 [Salinibacter phage M8CR30-2]AUO79048.1 hypothetical protein [Salinibacter phage M8CR30-2]
MEWQISHRADPRAKPLADRHYSRQTPDSPQFVRPGSCLVLWQPNALWVTVWQREEVTQHEWAGAWECSLFRNEGSRLSSTLIQNAVAATRWKYATMPTQGMVTFVDPAEVLEGEPGYCFRCAGFERVGLTEKREYYAWRLHPNEMPPPAPPLGVTRKLI